MTAHTPPQATPMGASPDPANATTGELVTRLSAQISELVRGELALAKTELAEKGKRAGIGAGLAGTAGVLGLLGKNQIQRATPPVPENTVESVKRDVATVSERIKR